SVHVRDVWVETVDIKVTMPAKVVIGGWRILAAIDIDEDGNNVIRSITDEDLPEWVRTVERGRCDHCGTNRRRKRLVVIARPSSVLDRGLLSTRTHKVIGTSCTRDYIGHDLSRFLNYHNVLCGYDIPGIPEDIDDSNAGHGPFMIGTRDFVATAADVISRTGYVRSGEPGATKEFVRYCYWNPGKMDEYLGEPLVHPVSAVDAIEWVKSLTGTSDFDHNLRTVAGSQALNPRHDGLAAYIPEAYRRHLAKKAEIEHTIEVGDAGHWGTVKERELLTATVTDVRIFETIHGTSAWVKATTEGGHKIQWKSSGRFPEAGDTITGKATVKEHAEWNDQSITTVQRWSWKLAE
ncbi:MAG: hypothetical protein GY926_26055, partial [bacterium]|nr:hypothetical protein [bacterium]